MALLLPPLLLATAAAASGPASITELHIASGGPAGACPAHTARIDAVAPWTGDFGGAGAGGLYLCAGRGGAGGSITALRAVGGASAAQAECPPGYAAVSGASGGLSSRGFVGLCVSRNTSIGPGIDELSGVLSKGAGKCPAGLTAGEPRNVYLTLPELLESEERF